MDPANVAAGRCISFPGRQFQVSAVCHLPVSASICGAFCSRQLVRGEGPLSRCGAPAWTATAELIYVGTMLQSPPRPEGVAGSVENLFPTSSSFERQSYRDPHSRSRVGIGVEEPAFIGWRPCRHRKAELPSKLIQTGRFRPAYSNEGPRSLNRRPRNPWPFTGNLTVCVYVSSMPKPTANAIR